MGKEDYSPKKKVFMKGSLWMGFLKAMELYVRQINQYMVGIEEIMNKMDMECGLGNKGDSYEGWFVNG